MSVSFVPEFAHGGGGVLGDRVSLYTLVHLTLDQTGLKITEVGLPLPLEFGLNEGVRTTQPSFPHL